MARSSTLFGTPQDRQALRASIIRKAKNDLLEATEKNEAAIKLRQLAHFIQQDENQRMLTPETNGELNFTGIGHFNASTRKEQNVIKLALDNFNEKQQALRTLDYKITFSVLGGILGLTLGALLGPLAWVGTAALMYSAYCYGARQKAYEEYQQALDDLANVYTWCFNDKQARIAKLGQKLTREVIQEKEAFDVLDENVANLVCTINPVLNDMDVKALTRNDIEDQFISGRKEAQDNAGAGQFDIDMEYLMYGRGQGSAKQVLMGILKMIGQCFSSLFHSCSPKAPETTLQATR